MFLLSINQITEYAGGENKACFKNGKKIYNTGFMIMQCGIGKIVQNMHHINGVVMKTTQPAADPHKIKVKFNSETNEIVAECSCVAGKSGKCKHCLAILIYMASESLEKLSPTEVAQKWGKLAENSKTKNLEAVKIANLCKTRKSNDKSDDLTDFQYKENFSTLINGFPNSALTLHLFTRNTLIQEEQSDDTVSFDELEIIIDNPSIIRNTFQDFLVNNNDYLEKLDLKIDKIAAIQIARTTSGKCEDYWKELTKNRITSAVCHEIIEYSKKKRPNWTSKLTSLYNKKFQEFNELQKSYNAFVWYKLTEPNLKKCGFIIHPQIPHLGSIIHGIVPDKRKIIYCITPTDGQKMSSLEMCHQLAKRKNSFIKYKNNEFTMDPKSSYFTKIQFSLFLTQCEVCDLLLYSKKEKCCFKIEVPFESKFAEHLIETLTNVYDTEFTTYLFLKEYDVSSENIFFKNTEANSSNLMELEPLYLNAEDPLYFKKKNFIEKEPSNLMELEPLNVNAEDPSNLMESESSNLNDNDWSEEDPPNLVELEPLNVNDNDLNVNADNQSDLVELEPLILKGQSEADEKKNTISNDSSASFITNTLESNDDSMQDFAEISNSIAKIQGTASKSEINQIINELVETGNKMQLYLDESEKRKEHLRKLKKKSLTYLTDNQLLSYVQKFTTEIYAQELDIFKKTRRTKTLKHSLLCIMTSELLNDQQLYVILKSLDSRFSPQERIVFDFTDFEQEYLVPEFVIFLFMHIFKENRNTAINFVIDQAEKIGREL